MHRAALATVSTVAGVILLLTVKPHQDPGPTASPPGTPTSTSGGTSAPPGPQAIAGARSGTFTGDTIDTRYGPVQVAITLAEGKLTGVQVLQTPSDNDRDRRIAARAVPRLTQEALAAQSATIHTVSGATYTSRGYIDSLQSALDQAHG
ncbi:FMN-binding protein [Embleya sp. NPDC005575]|uniref:FMN-binding protein n=1 Tax=Embleya sp. NPDC005575 TaxID=3156892 RepID=UPI0033A99FCC